MARYYVAYHIPGRYDTVDWGGTDGPLAKGCVFVANIRNGVSTVSNCCGSDCIRYLWEGVTGDDLSSLLEEIPGTRT